MFARPTNYYVDPDSGSDSTGDGSSGTPWKTIQHALDNITQGSNGDTINIADTATASESGLDLSTYGTPGFNTPLTLRGWGGGTGIATIDLGTNDGVWVSETYSHVHAKDLIIQNGGTHDLWHVNDNSMLVACELTDTDGTAVDMRNSGLVEACNIHNIGTYGVRINDAVKVCNSRFANDSREFVRAVFLAGSIASLSSRNIISLDGASDGILITNSEHRVEHNSILSSAGTGAGIRVASAAVELAIVSNIVEGFSGAGGVGYDIPLPRELGLFAGNAAYNNTTDYNEAALLVFDEIDNEVLASSPFAKSGSDTFANRGTYFEPQDVGNVRGGAYPTELRLDKGAVQHADPGGLLRHPGANGGLSA